MKLLAALLCFGIIAGRGATTDGYVYLGHNEDQWGEQMLNIYNVPAGKDRCAYLWFEFPGQKAGDSFINEYGVCISSDQCLSREDRAEGSLVYEIRTTAIRKARSAREAVHIIGRFVEGAHQPVWFGEPSLFSPRDTGNSFYTSYTSLDGECILWFGDQKYYLFGKVMD